MVPCYPQGINSNPSQCLKPNPIHIHMYTMYFSIYTYLSVQRNRGNNRMGNTRDLLKKTGDTKGTFHAKMVSIKDRNGMDLTEAEDIKKRWKEYTEELYKKDLHDPR